MTGHATRSGLDRPPGRLAPVARLLGATEGQVYTLGIAFAVALASVLGLSGAVRPGPEILTPSVAAAAPGPAASPAVAGPPADPGAVPAAEFGPSAPRPGIASPSRAPRIPPSSPGDAAESAAEALAHGAVRRFASVGGAPDAVAVAPDGSVWVATNGGADDDGRPAVVHLDAGGAVVARHRVGAGATLTGIAVGPTGRVFVLSSAPAAVQEIDTGTGSVTTVATIPAVGPCVPVIVAEPCEGDLADGPPTPRDVVALGDVLLVSDAGQGLIWSVDPRSGATSLWVKDDGFHPAVGVGGPAGLALGADSLLVVVSASGPTGEPALFKVGLRGTAAGPVTAVATLSSGDAPFDVVTTGGGYAVSMSAANAVAVLDGSGVETSRVGAPDSMKSPMGIATRGPSLLVADRGAGTIVEVGLGA